MPKEAERLIIVLIHFIVWPVQVLGTICHPRPKSIIPPLFTGSFALDETGHLRSRIICGPFWESFAVGDHLRYCTVLEPSSGLIRHCLPKHKIVLIPGWSHRGVCDAYCTIWGSILLSGNLPEATAESSHFKWSLTVGSTVRCAYAGWSSHLYNLKFSLLS